MFNNVYSQNKQREAKDINAASIGYVHLPGYNKGGFHFDILLITENIAASTGVEFFMLNKCALTFFNVDIGYPLTKKIVYIYPYAGLSLGIYSDNEGIGSYDIWDYADGGKIGVRLGCAAIIDINGLTLGASYGLNSIMKSSKLLSFTIGFSW